MATALSLLTFCLAFATVRALVTPDLEYLSPVDYDGKYDSAVCVYSSYEKPRAILPLFNVTWGKIIREDCPVLLNVLPSECGVSTASTKEDIQLRINGTVFPLNSLVVNCRHCFSSQSKYVVGNAFWNRGENVLIEFGIAVTAYVHDFGANDAYFIPGFRAISSAGSYPLNIATVACSRQPPPYGGINYTADIVQKNTSARFNLKVSENPWVAVLNSIFYNIIARIVALMYIYVGCYLAPLYFINHYRDKGRTTKVPHPPRT